MLRAVVDGMEAPQKGDFVRPAMAPIETNLADYQPGEDALPQRPGCDSSLHAVWDDRVGTQRGKGKRKGEQQARYQAAYEIIAQILSKALAEEFLRIDRKSTRLNSSHLVISY